MFRLTLTFAGKPIRKFNFDQDAVCIGRDPDCEILIDNIGVSRKHATIEKANGEYILTDLKSHNGTFVRGQRIYHHQLRDGDEFFIGKYSLSFENLDIDTEPAPSAPEVKNPGMQEMTFRLDKSEIEKIMGASSIGNVPKIAQIAPESETRTVRLDKDYFFIGKAPMADLRISGAFVPWLAAVLVQEEKRFVIFSLRKRRTVIVNGQRVRKHLLADGDLFQIGRRKFRFALS